MAGGVTAPSGGGGRRGRTRRYRPRADINITPFVDVMLVLLIVFMVSAPMMTVGVPLELPKTQAGPLNQDKEPLTISFDAEGRLYLMNTEMTVDDLIAKLRAIGESAPDQRIYVRSDKSVPYGRVMEVMGALNAAGFRKIGLITDAAPRKATP